VNARLWGFVDNPDSTLSRVRWFLPLDTLVVVLFLLATGRRYCWSCPCSYQRTLMRSLISPDRWLCVRSFKHWLSGVWRKQRCQHHDQIHRLTMKLVWHSQNSVSMWTVTEDKMCSGPKTSIYWLKVNVLIKDQLRVEQQLILKYTDIEFATRELPRLVRRVEKLVNGNYTSTVNIDSWFFSSLNNLNAHHGMTITVKFSESIKLFRLTCPLIDWWLLLLFETVI